MDSSFLLSLELIHLMSWLIKNEKSGLKALIQEALANGLGKELDNLIESKKEYNNDKLHETFVSFLAYLEKTLMGSLEQNDRKKPLRENLIASLKELNLNNIDTHTLLTSIKQVETDLTPAFEEGKATNKEMKSLLLEKVLKNWKPSKKEILN